MNRDPRDPAGIDELSRAWAEADAIDFANEAEAAAADPERIWRVAAGESSDGEVEALALAAATDSRISLAWRLARELGAGDDATESERATRARPGTPRPARGAWRAWPIAAALAATVLVAIGIELLRPDRRAPDSIWRDGAADASLVSPSEDGARRPRGAFVLRWRGGDEPSTRYTVRVTTDDLGLVYEVSDLAASQVTVPEAALSAWPAGTTLYWQVEARGPDGRLRASPAVRVVIADREPREAIEGIDKERRP